MTIEIITDHDAAMREACRRPLGTDQQVRFPEAAPVSTEEEDGFGCIKGMLNWYAACSAALVLFCIGAMIAVVMR